MIGWKLYRLLIGWKPMLGALYRLLIGWKPMIGALYGLLIGWKPMTMGMFILRKCCISIISGESLLCVKDSLFVHFILHVFNSIIYYIEEGKNQGLSAFKDQLFRRRKKAVSIIKFVF